MHRPLALGVVEGSVVHVEAERLILATLAFDLLEAMDEVGETALEEDRDDAGVRDLDDLDVVDAAAGDDERDDADRGADLRLESFETMGCTALISPGAGPIVDRRRLFEGELMGSSASKSKASLAKS